MLVYHIANKKFKDIRPIALQSKGQKKKEELIKTGYGLEYINKYIYEINFFLGVPSKEQISRMINEGFKNWNMGDTYVHVVDLNKINRLDYNYVSMTSTSQQREYDLLYWDKFFKKYEDVFKNGTDEEWYEVKKEHYLSKREEYLLKKYGIKETMTIQELVTHPLLEDWRDFDKHFEYNLKHGNKDQYASYIPHVQISVSNPIKPIEVIKI